VITEAQFQEQVTDLAAICGWRWNHTRRSIGKGRRWTTATSIKGFPDLLLWHPEHGGLLLVELKTDKGALTTEQDDVLESLRKAGVDARVWRPRDFEDEIYPKLTAHRKVPT
jgi:hypothetical protein